MPQGEKAAEQTKSVFHQVGQAGEDIRNSINSFADDLLGGNKSHGGKDVHPDAKKAGHELERGVNEAGRKIEGFMDKHKK